MSLVWVLGHVKGWNYEYRVLIWGNTVLVPSGGITWSTFTMQHWHLHIKGLRNCYASVVQRIMVRSKCADLMLPLVLYRPLQLPMNIIESLMFTIVLILRVSRLAFYFCMQALYFTTPKEPRKNQAFYSNDVEGSSWNKVLSKIK